MSRLIIGQIETREDEDGPLFWNNEHGWVDLASADTFSVIDIAILDLPINGTWIFHTNGIGEIEPAEDG